MNFEHFDTNLMGAADCGYMVSTEKPVKKIDFKGLKIAWVDMKSKFEQLGTRIRFSQSCLTMARNDFYS